MSSAKATVAAPAYTEGEQEALSQTLGGALRVTVSGSGPSGATVVVGDDTPSDAFVNPTDAVGAWALGGMWHDGTSRWERMRMTVVGGESLAFNAKCLLTSGPVQPYGNDLGSYGFLTSNVPGDAIVNPASALLANINCNGFELGFDGTVWRRRRSTTDGYARNTASPPNVTDAIEATSSALAAGTSGMVGVISAARAKLLAFDARTLVALGGWFQLFNKATAPILNDAPVASFKLKLNADSDIIIPRGFYGETGRLFTTGISWGFSSTPTAFTVAADSPYSVNASYVA